jgi:hypothetical protein
VRRGGASSLDGPSSMRAPARHSLLRGSNRGSAVCSARGADWPSCLPCGTLAWSSSADGADYLGPDGINPSSADTYVVCAVSSACPLVYANDWELRRTSTKKTALVDVEGTRQKNGRRGWKETGGKKKPKKIHYTFKPLVPLHIQNGADTARAASGKCDMLRKPSHKSASGKLRASSSATPSAPPRQRRWS